MKINYDNDGNILSAGWGLGWSGIEYTDPLPADFMDTFALGKYKGRVVGDTVEVYAVPGWVPPPPPEPMP
jgi:hypothetical protein